MLKPVDIESAWEQIEPIAESLMTDPDEYGPDVMLEACRSGQAVCLQNEDGYLVTTVQINGKTGLREYVIWWGSTEGPSQGAFERAIPELRAAAEKLGCANLVFYSSRPGWFRRAKAGGFRLRTAEYVMPVERSH